jgi:hypothetical protein
VRLSAHGITTDLPAGWEGRITRRRRPTAVSARAGGPGPVGSPEEVPEPVVHLANFALPEDRGDFGSGAVDLMGAEHALVVLFEYGPECAGTALFRRRGMPTRLTPAMFSPSALQRTLPGQAGCQVFFTAGDRAFCCYTVLGKQSAAARMLPQVNSTLAGTKIGPR